MAKDKEKEEKVNMQLADLKNKVCFGYLMMNATFVVIIFTLQQNKERVSILSLIVPMEEIIDMWISGRL